VHAVDTVGFRLGAPLSTPPAVGVHSLFIYLSATTQMHAVTTLYDSYCLYVYCTTKYSTVVVR
jgi:hypothetical protein